MSDSDVDVDVDAFLEAQTEGFIPVEYKVVEINSFSDDLEEALNALGSEGWDLVVWDGSRAIFTRC